MSRHLAYLDNDGLPYYQVSGDHRTRRDSSYLPEPAQLDPDRALTTRRNRSSSINDIDRYDHQRRLDDLQLQVDRRDKHKSSRRESHDHQSRHRRKSHDQSANVLYTVICTKQFIGSQPGDLSLHLGDVVNVTSERSSGNWLQGDNVVTRQHGIFPVNHVRRLMAEGLRERTASQDRPHRKEEAHVDMREEAPLEKIDKTEKRSKQRSVSPLPWTTIRTSNTGYRQAQQRAPYTLATAPPTTTQMVPYAQQSVQQPVYYPTAPPQVPATAPVYAPGPVYQPAQMMAPVTQVQQIQKPGLGKRIGGTLGQAFLFGAGATVGADLVNDVLN